MDHEERKHRADAIAQPEFYYSYILQFDDDGSFYVGSTNDPAARYAEHAIGVGAVETSGRRFKVRLVNQFGTRREAEYNENRINDALKKGPSNIEAMIDNFDRINQMIRPQKTFSELRKEEELYVRDMETVFHHSTALLGMGSYSRPTACGWKGKHYGTPDWSVLIHQARIEDIIDADEKVQISVGRRICRRCLTVAPPDPATSGEETVST